MEFLQQIIDFVLHIDKHLTEIIAQYGTLTYAILFLIIFAETGFVVTPFLPGDSLLFAVGALAAQGALNVWLFIVLVLIAAFTGNMVNYYIGRQMSARILTQGKLRFIKREYLTKTQDFYVKHGAKAVVIGRFLPIFRTFVPFVAGIGMMEAGKFTFYNLLGAVLWVIPFTLAGFWFGNIPFVKENFTLVVLAIIGVTILPAIIAAIRIKFQQKHT
ncbi:MAG TPA: DedA family protein [Chitinophagales bacterium]|nr:DedA family protein [Chitinophagales bacterium]HRK27201.1 DedA family protein [Chitinophagales bacterium]